MTKIKTDFKPFGVGTVFNPIKGGPFIIIENFNRVSIKYPSRLDLMAIDPSKISSNNNLVYTPGEIILKVDQYRTVNIEKIKDGSDIIISDQSKRKSLIKHSALIMREALKFKCGLKIDVENYDEIRHMGFGSSSALIASVACAINELFGNPIAPRDLVQYTAQNHGEEIDGETNLISPVQCIGGSSAGGQHEGALMILAGESRVIGTMKLSNDYKVIVGLPKDFIELDSEELLVKELEVMDNFINCGKTYGPKIAYKILHYVLPAMLEGDLTTVGDMIYEYRFEMGSIENCSYCYPPLTSLCNRLAYLKKNDIVDLLSISSVGPAIVAVTKNIETCKTAFKKENLKIFVFNPENKKYIVLNKH